ncbi:MAG: hypothetical protein R3E90_11550 [Marinicella sp.]
MAFAVETCDYVDEPAEYGETEYTDEQLAYFDEMMDENHTITEEERWMIDLNKHLMQHNAINIAIIALNMLDIDADRFNTQYRIPVLDI